MTNKKNMTLEGLWAIKRALRHNHNIIDDLREKIAQNNIYKSNYENTLNIVQDIFDGTNIEGHQQLIEWCKSKSIEYQKFGIKAP